MATEYIVWICIEQCEVDGDDFDRIESVSEPRQAGRFKTECSASEHVDYLLQQAHAARKCRARPSNRRR